MGARRTEQDWMGCHPRAQVGRKGPREVRGDPAPDPCLGPLEPPAPRVHHLSLRQPRPQRSASGSLLKRFGKNSDFPGYVPQFNNCSRLKTGVSVCLLLLLSRSVVSDSVTPWTASRQASLSITNSRSSLKLMSIESMMPSSHLILCHPLLLLPSIFPSVRVFSNESALRIRWPKYWTFSFSISISNEYSGFISFRMDWLDLLAVQGTLKSLLQHHSSNASILQHSAFFMVIYVL